MPNLEIPESKKDPLLQINVRYYLATRKGNVTPQERCVLVCLFKSILESWKYLAISIVSHLCVQLLEYMLVL